MNKRKVQSLQANLLQWYDKYQRILPWRAKKGQKPDPYHIWLSEIMLQQTTVVTVGPYFTKFLTLWPRVRDLARADLDDVLTAWAGLGYYARARNLHKCANVVTNEYGGTFPHDLDALQSLPGIGPYTAAAIASIAFDQPATAVDGNVERVVSRFFAITDPLPLSKPLIKEKASMLTAGVERSGDYTQSLMELGATICTPKNPKCGQCPWVKKCEGYAQGIHLDLPRKVPKKKKPVRFGKVFWVSDLDKKGKFLIHKRGDQGLYAGMYQLPTTDWITGKKEALGQTLPYLKNMQNLNVTVRHSFTHFDLVLEVWTGRLRARRTVPQSAWISYKSLDKYALPTLMKKAVKLCVSEKDRIS